MAIIETAAVVAIATTVGPELVAGATVLGAKAMAGLTAATTFVGAVKTIKDGVEVAKTAHDIISAGQDAAELADNILNKSEEKEKSKENAVATQEKATEIKHDHVQDVLAERQNPNLDGPAPAA